MALNYDWTAMTTLVNSMTPNGNTNQAIGLQLGWQSLVGGGPFPAPPVMDPNYQYSQVIILLTDGLNTQDRWYTSQNSIDTRQAMTCANVKAAGITLYTVQVNTGGDPTSTLLKNCASDCEQVLPADVGDPDRRNVPADRHGALQPAGREVDDIRLKFRRLLLRPLPQGEGSITQAAALAKPPQR